MVVFTCNHCGETLQKPRVAKHYQFQCRRGKFLTCVDCHKDFRDEEYGAHTKCITEAERYGGKDYVPKTSANKGEKKQQAWINVVHNLLNSAVNLTYAERNFLNSLSKYENIPRKKAKFLNFIRSAFGNRINSTVIEGVWVKMEAAHQEAVAVSPTEGNQTDKEEAKDVSCKQQCDDNVAENENNENTSRENGSEQNGNGISMITEETDSSKKKRKSKKRELSESQAQQILEEPISKKNKTLSETNEHINGKNAEEQSNGAENSTFSWKTVISEIVRAKGEMSLKKLQKKAVARYLAETADPVSEEKAIVKFNKKLKKVSEIVVCDDTVRLA